jgi:transposase
MVIDSHARSHKLRELGLNEGTLGNWVSTWKKEHAHEEAPLTVPERHGYANSNAKLVNCVCTTSS